MKSWQTRFIVALGHPMIDLLTYKYHLTFVLRWQVPQLNGGLGSPEKG